MTTEPQDAKPESGVQPSLAGPTEKLARVFHDTTNSYKLVCFLAILRLIKETRGQKARFSLTEILLEAAEPLVRQELLEQGKGTSAAALAAVYADYAAIRKAGIAFSHGARRRGLNALSVPLVDYEGKVIAAVSVLGTAPEFDAMPTGAAGKLLKQLGHELSSLLGGPQQA